MIGLGSYQDTKVCDVCGRAYLHSAKFARCPEHEHVDVPHDDESEKETGDE